MLLIKMYCCPTGRGTKINMNKFAADMRAFFSRRSYIYFNKNHLFVYWNVACVSDIIHMYIYWICETI